MSSLKKSDELIWLLDYARNKYGAGGSCALICESVLLAAIDVALREVGDHIAHGREHWMIYRMLRRQFPEDPGFGQIREALTGYLATESSNEMANILVFQARMHRAEAKAVSDEKEELTPSDLLSAILADPTEQIKSCIPGPEDDESAFEADDDIDNGETIEIRVEEPDTPEKNVERLAQVTEETKKLYTELNRRVLGQQNAVSVFASGYFQSQLLSMTEAERKKPNATFLFAGPPGVGKTFLAENVADILGLPFYRADMSGYSDKEAAIEFAGSDRVYKNAKSGNVTSFVHENPKCVLLFDEIEKAHINVIHLFLQILDAGRLRDAYTDEEVSFTDALMIFTTNAGRQIYEDSESPDLSGISRKVIIKALQTDVNPATKEPYFPAAICSRFASGNVVMFNHVTAGALMSIVGTELRRHADNFEKRFGIDISIDERVAASLLFAEGGASDARTMRARAEAFFNGETFELFRLLGSKKVGNGIKSLKKVEFSVELPEEDKEIAGLFEKESPCTLLAFTSRSKIKKCVESCPSVRFLEAHSAAEAERKLRENDVDDVLIDIGFGRRGDAAYLNVEDVDSEARDLLKYLSEIGSDVPVYILESGRSSLSNEEKDSFNRRGVRGYLTLSGASDPEQFDRDVKEITHSQQMQRSMEYLARSCKVVSFDTAQLLDDNGTRATVKLFDFRLHPAVDAEDASSVLNSVSKPDVLFETVIGAEEAKKELRYFVDYLKNPRKYLGTGLSAPKGVLLYGPPGTGKTMLAKAVAGESDVTFISAEGNQFVNQFQGVGRDRLKKLFSIARKYAPSILFIDEIDAIAGARTGASGDNATLTALLTEMDGFSGNAGRPVFVLGATNFDPSDTGARALDPALMRRFDRKLYIGLPTAEERRRYLLVRFAKNSAFEVSDKKIDEIIARSAGMSLADLAQVIELSMRNAIRAGSLKVTDEVFEESFESCNGGEAQKSAEDVLLRVARHEAGHAAVCFDAGETPSYLTVVSRGNRGGYMLHSVDEDKFIYTADELLARIRASLGGRAAEIVYYGERDGVSTGASGDLVNATALARQFICAYGMDAEFGLSVVDYRAAAEGELSAEVRAAVNRILERELAGAIGIIEERREAVDALVSELVAKNYLNSDEIERILSK